MFFSSKIMDTAKNTVYIVRIDIKVGQSGYKGSKKAIFQGISKNLHNEHINPDVFIHHADDFCTSSCLQRFQSRLGLCDFL